jgi:hypothetical protein
MANINQLSSTSTLQGGDLLAVWAQDNGDTRKASLNLVSDYVVGTIELPMDIMRSQYSAPSATGFTVAITSANTWLVLNPTNTFAAGTIVLPTGVADLSMVSVVTTQAITALTVSVSGAAVVGAPTSAAANTAFTLRYDGVTNSWYPENQNFLSATAFALTLLNDPDAATARATLGLGSISTQSAGSVAITGGTISGITSLATSNATITGGTITGITDLAIADGGTGSSTASGARTNLGAGVVGANVFTAATVAAAQQAMDTEIGVDVQAYDADLSALAGLSTNGMIARTGAGTASVRTITAGAGISVANGDGVAGNPTITSTDVLENVSAATIASIVNAINTTGKAAGRMVWDTTNSKIKVATGALAASTWVDAAGTNAVTPS